MGLFESFATVTSWRAVSVLVLAWLAFFFGRTLRTDRVPMIERIARVSDPALTPGLCRYTRRLTAVWCAYFVIAALVVAIVQPPLAWTSTLIWIGALLLFVGEHGLRPHIFPGHRFPGVVQQLRDTLHVWRQRP